MISVYGAHVFFRWPQTSSVAHILGGEPGKSEAETQGETQREPAACRGAAQQAGAWRQLGSLASAPRAGQSHEKSTNGTNCSAGNDRNPKSGQLCLDDIFGMGKNGVLRLKMKVLGKIKISTLLTTCVITASAGPRPFALCTVSLLKPMIPCEKGALAGSMSQRTREVKALAYGLTARKQRSRALVLRPHLSPPHWLQVTSLFM